MCALQCHIVQIFRHIVRTTIQPLCKPGYYKNDQWHQRFTKDHACPYFLRYWRGLIPFVFLKYLDMCSTPGNPKS